MNPSQAGRGGYPAKPPVLLVDASRVGAVVRELFGGAEELRGVRQVKSPASSGGKCGAWRKYGVAEPGGLLLLHLVEVTHDAAGDRLQRAGLVTEEDVSEFVREVAVLSGPLVLRVVDDNGAGGRPDGGGRPAMGVLDEDLEGILRHEGHAVDLGRGPHGDAVVAQERERVDGVGRLKAQERALFRGGALRLALEPASQGHRSRSSAPSAPAAAAM